MKSQEEKHIPSSHAEGAISALAVLRGESRPIYKIMLSPRADRENKNIAEVLRLALEREIPVEEASEEDLAQMVGGSTHGGLVALVGERKMLGMEELLSQKRNFYFMLCGIEDPYNFGDAVRSLYAFGAEGMLLSPRNWLSAAAITIRSSAGASELMDCAICDDEEELARICKEKGISILCAGEKNAESLHRTRLKPPFLLIIGGEKRGISRYLLEKADQHIRIPYGRNFAHSLSASAAAAAIGFEITRQARQSKYSQHNKHSKGKAKS